MAIFNLGLLFGGVAGFVAGAMLGFPARRRSCSRCPASLLALVIARAAGAARIPASSRSSVPLLARLRAARAAFVGERASCCASARCAG